MNDATSAQQNCDRLNIKYDWILPLSVCESSAVWHAGMKETGNCSDERSGAIWEKPVKL